MADDYNAGDQFIQSARAWAARERNYMGLVNRALGQSRQIGRLPRAVASALHQTPEHEEVVTKTATTTLIATISNKSTGMIGLGASIAAILAAR
jgi:hypothetical protein